MVKNEKDKKGKEKEKEKDTVKKESEKEKDTEIDEIKSKKRSAPVSSPKQSPASKQKQNKSSKKWVKTIFYFIFSVSLFFSNILCTTVAFVGAGATAGVALGAVS